MKSIKFLLYPDFIVNKRILYNLREHIIYIYIYIISVTILQQNTIKCNNYTRVVK